MFCDLAFYMKLAKVVIAVSMNRAKEISRNVREKKNPDFRISLNCYQKPSMERKEEILKHQEEEQSVTLSRKDVLN